MSLLQRWLDSWWDGSVPDRARIIEMLPARIVIVDDDEIFRQELHRLFDEHHEFSIVGEASNAAAAIDVVRCVALDILLLNLHIQDMTGRGVLHKLRRLANFRTILLG